MPESVLYYTQQISQAIREHLKSDNSKGEDNVFLIKFSMRLKAAVDQREGTLYSYTPGDHSPLSLSEYSHTATH